NLEAGFLWGQTVNLIGLGRLLRELKRDTLAEAYLQRAQETVAKFGAAHLSQQIHQQLSQLYEQRGDYASALQHHIAFHEHHQAIAQKAMSSRANKLAARRLAAAEIKLKLLSSEIELSQLRQQTSERASRLQQLENAAYRDGLTGAFNRRALDERLPLLIAQAQQQGSVLSLLVVDFDHFKTINDTYTHQVGDRVLQEGARQMQATLRDGDTLFRYGGEEFTLVLGDTALTGALRLAERIRERLEAWPWGDVASGLRATISVGATTLMPGDTPAELLRRADLALYQAKRAGRNRVASSGDTHA
ncbi:MAG TPA: GGDEF domain-containing protein, partial [Chitinolyticbacter sp.]|nr:GGDEF domain-containing protein [Chitinolyticbacter sp.]